MFKSWDFSFPVYPDNHILHKYQSFLGRSISNETPGPHSFASCFFLHSTYHHNMVYLLLYCLPATPPH